MIGRGATWGEPLSRVDVSCVTVAGGPAANSAAQISVCQDGATPASRYTPGYSTIQRSARMRRNIDESVMPRASACARENTPHCRSAIWATRASRLALVMPHLIDGV